MSRSQPLYVKTPVNISRIEILHFVLSFKKRYCPDTKSIGILFLKYLPIHLLVLLQTKLNANKLRLSLKEPNNKLI
jgi:hypothetical protein